jgi:hypothetical protein
MTPLPQNHIDKTLLGIVTSWTDLFIEHRYAKTDRSGSPWVTHHPGTFNFLSSKADQVRMFGKPHEWLALYVKANPKIEPVIDARMTPPINQPMRQIRNNIQSYEIIPWPAYGHALITANDWNSIAHLWVCFIPLDAVPEISPDNTPRFTETDWERNRA